MINKLKELIFGLNEFEKTKIEFRFGLIADLVKNLKINELGDFETLEEIIYKIKEQLRVKSSNLNKTISNPAKSLKKRNVIEILEQLNKVKYDFLKKAFSLIKEHSVSPAITETPKIPKAPSNEISKEILKEADKSSEKNILFQNERVKLILENGKTPYVVAKFEEDIDLVLLKNIASLLYEVYNAQGTNIMIENNVALIVPRFEDDNLFEMPRVDINIDEVYNKILKIVSHKDENIKESSPRVVEADYVEVNTNTKTQKKSSKSDDMSLDALLSEEENRKITPKPQPQKDKEKLKLILDDPITIQKEVKTTKEPEIEIIKETKDTEIQKSVDTEKIEERAKKSEESLNLNLQTQIPKEKFEIYRDDKIVAYLSENSKALGELIVKPMSGNKIKDLNDSDLSYMMIFSKVFSSILFEVMQAHGTNLIFDYDNGVLKIVPRFKEDTLSLNWTPKQDSDEFLEQIKNKLLTRMHKELGGDEQKIEEKKEVKKVPKEDENMKKKKAQHILDAIRKIP